MNDHASIPIVSCFVFTYIHIPNRIGLLIYSSQLNSISAAMLSTFVPSFPSVFFCLVCLIHFSVRIYHPRVLDMLILAIVFIFFDSSFAHLS
jgi:hypothetical protein